MQKVLKSLQGDNKIYNRSLIVTVSDAQKHRQTDGRTHTHTHIQPLPHRLNHTHPQTDGQTDGLTHRQTELLPKHELVDFRRHQEARTDRTALDAVRVWVFGDDARPNLLRCPSRVLHM